MTKILRNIGIAAPSASCSALVLCSVAIFPAGAVAQTYPAKPMRIVVPNVPGSGTDVIARLIGGKLSEALGQPIVTDNRAGASGRIGVEVAARSAPDGYTLLLLTSSNAIASAMYENLNYDLVKDFSPISLMGTTPFVLVVTPSLKATSVKELVALAKSRPGELRYGQGSEANHLSAEIFKFITGCEILNVPYKGSALALTGTLGGEVHMAFQSIPSVMPMIKSGKLRALGVTSARRTPMVPEVPSISEFVPDYEYTGWYALVAPAKTPRLIISKLHAEVVKALNNPAMRERLAALGVDTLGTSPRESETYLKAQLEQTKQAVKVSGIRPES